VLGMQPPCAAPTHRAPPLAHGRRSFSINVVLMMLGGFFVNGPYALITTAVSADLGSHESLQVWFGFLLPRLLAHFPTRQSCQDSIEQFPPR